MDVIEAIKSRRTIRKFQSKSIPDKVLYAILDAANYAPAAGSYYNWRFIIITDSANKSVLANASYGQEFITGAPVLVLVCSDSDALINDFGDEKGKDYALQNSSAAMQNILLAAYNFGVGSCWCGIDKEKAIREALRIPDNIDVHGLIALGYPKEAPRMSGKLNLGDVTFFNKWDNRVKRSSPLFPLLEKFESAAKKVTSKLKLKRKASKNKK
ncbi:MAG: nitroreductase family protein [DPANN group archaeon]|nr:nitroreductase family protein [DPANN group archaeon]